MRNIIAYRGRRGERGQNGLDGLFKSDVRIDLINGPLLDLYYNNKPERVAVNAVSNRTGEALITNRYGGFDWVSSDDRTNYIKWSNNFSQWSDVNNVWSIVNNTTADPVGGNSATTINIDANIASGTSFVIETIAENLESFRFYTFSFWFKVISGTVQQLEMWIGGTSYRIDANLNSTWQRVKISVAPNVGNALFSIVPVCSAGTRIALYQAQLENGSLMTDIMPTTGAEVTQPRNTPALRSNNFGYLFEGQSQNLIKNSENLTYNTWSSVSGTVTEYGDLDQFGQRYTKALISNTGTTSTQLSTTVTVTAGQEYTLSFFGRVAGGSVTSVLASIGQDGEVGAISDITTGDIQRYSIPLIAGTDGILRISLNSTDGNGVLFASGWQLEAGKLTSYIRNGNSTNTRSTDATTVDYTINKPSDKWTFRFTDSVIVSDNIKYIFSNGLTGADGFGAYLQSGSLTVFNGLQAVTANNISDAQSLAVTFDGANCIIYKDKYPIKTGTFSAPSTAVASVLYIGTDGNFNNSIDGYLSALTFWGDTLTAKEIRFLGVK